MNKLKYINLIILFLLVFSSSSQAGEEHGGTSAASFLKIGIGAKATGMGQTHCAVADDSTALYWNPAGLVLLKRNEMSYMHNLWFGEITHGFLGYAHPLKNLSLGVGIDYLTIGEIEETTELEPRGTGKKFRLEEDVAFFVSASKRIRENLSLGMNLKYILQEVAGERAMGCGTDLGLFYKLHLLNLGLVIQNLGPGMRFTEKEFALPFNIKTGLAYKGIKNTILALDVNLPRDNRASYHLGVEYRIGDLLAMRAGYNSRITENKLGRFNLGEGLSTGFGINFKATQLDVAYIHYGDLGDTYQVSLLTRFGKAEGR
ncbi:MAG: PorV/PorQ family protein [bacterium]|nr:PorV/PorQ family protein [bacterium]